MEDPILLDATMVRCVANRDSVNYDPECVSAREAVERIAAAEKGARRAALEAESERKQKALRRAQEAADDARRRAAEAQRLREEARLFGLLPATPEEPVTDSGELSFIEVDDGEATARVTVQGLPVPVQEAAVPGGVEPASAEAESPTVTPDLGEIREELEERQPVAPPETSD